MKKKLIRILLNTLDVFSYYDFTHILFKIFFFIQYINLSVMFFIKHVYFGYKL